MYLKSTKKTDFVLKYFRIFLYLPKTVLAKNKISLKHVSGLFYVLTKNLTYSGWFHEFKIFLGSLNRYNPFEDNLNLCIILFKDCNLRGVRLNSISIVVNNTLDT